MVINNQEATLATQSNNRATDASEIFNSLRGISNDPAAIALGTYAAYLMVDSQRPYKEAIESNCTNGMLRTYLLESVDAQVQDIATILSTNDFSIDKLREFVVSGSFGLRSSHTGGTEATPDCINELAIRILDIKDGDKISDPCCGFGRFLVEASRISGAKLYGNEINLQSAMVAIASLALIEAEAEISIADTLAEPSKKKFDKVLSNFPFGMRTSFMKGRGKYYDIIRNGKEVIGRPMSADWVFALAAYDSLADGGKALCIMTDGALFNGTDKQARRYFVNNGMIQAIISLPRALFQATSIPTNAVVLGKNKGAIRMVDASGLSVPGRRWDYMGEDEINEIMQRLTVDSEFSKSVDRKAIEEADFSLSVLHYLGRNVELINPTSISDITLSIERGANYRAVDLDDMATLEDTGCCYLKLGDINDGIIGNNLTNLTKLDSKTKNQWLRTGDLVISKNGAPFKIAVADIPEDRKVLANGNLYILRLDPEKADPYYVAAFLASEDGKEVMGREVVGTAIPNLPLSNLKRMQIALPPLEEQKRIGELYRARLDEIEMLRIKLEKARITAAETYIEAVSR